MIMKSRVDVSAVIITFNEERKIERCLKSLDWVAEIVIVDSFSTDRTIEICRRYTDKVFQHPWPKDYSRQRNIAIAYASHDWVLSLDADEVVTVSLRDEIMAMLTRAMQADSYGIPRHEFFAGKWINAGGWYPQYKYILYRRSMGKWVSPVHEKFVTSGTTALLKSPILHDGTGDFRTFMEKFNHFSSFEAERNYGSGKKFSILKAIFQPLERFFGRFIVRRGYRDGLHGFYMAVVVGLYYFLREMKVYEQQYRDRNIETWDKVYRDTAVGGGK